MSQALYRKWRPTSWDEVVGQDHIVQTLHNAVETDRVGHAYLFAGPRGTGKTSSARLLAKAVNCLHEDLAQRPCNTCANCVAVNQGRFLDLIEIDAASNTSVEDVRDLRDKINFSPSQGKFKVYIIDEVHMLSTSAFNALLKTLEEPPPHVIFILATTEIHKIPATVLSRCQRHEFRRIPIQIITSKLRLLCEEEAIHISDETLTLIARQSTGSLRDAISLVDQLSSMTQDISLEIAQDMLGTATSQVVIELVSAILHKDDAGGLSMIHQALDAGSDPRQFARQVIDYLRNLLLIKMGLMRQVDAPADIKSNMTDHAEQFDIKVLLESINAFSNAATDLKASWHPGLGLEMAFARIITSDNNSTQPQPVTQTVKEPAVMHVAEAATQEQALPTPTPKKPEPLVKQAKSSKNKPGQNASQPKPGQSTDPEQMSMRDIQKKWKVVRELIRKENPRTEALINSSRLLNLHNDTLLLSFSSELLKGKMLKENNIALTCRALKQVFGKDLRVDCIVGSPSHKDLPSDLDFDSDGVVGTATSQLGAQIVDIE